MVDVKELVAQLRAVVQSARSLPMSASAVVNRDEVLDLVSKLEEALPSAFAAQDSVVSERDSVVGGGRDESERIIAEAERTRDRLVAESEVLRVARDEAERERAAARTEAEELRKDTDAYVDTRLATFEITLSKTLEAVSLGRSRLQGRSHFDALGESAAEDPSAGEQGLTTPDELRPPEPPQVG